jgi:hypothetical protein
MLLSALPCGMVHPGQGVNLRRGEGLDAVCGVAGADGTPRVRFSFMVTAFPGVPPARSRRRDRTVRDIKLWVLGGSFRLLHRLLAQVERRLDINQLDPITRAVVKPDRESLVIEQV